MSGCGGEDTPVVTAAPINETTIAEALITETPESGKVENLVPKIEPAEDSGSRDDVPIIEIAEESDDFDDEEKHQKTILSIIEQLQQRDQFAEKENSDTLISEKLTTNRVKQSDGSTNDKVIWNIDAGNQDIKTQEQLVIPEGSDPSLAAEALAAAFALVRDHTDISDTLVQEEGTAIDVIAKPEQGVRAAILAPLEGRAASIGREMQYGAELAIFTLDNQKIDLTFHDTSQGINTAMNAAMLQKPDVIIGPLFAENTRRAKQVAQIANIPVLSFSNDSSVAGQGAWLFGQTPEQEIETVLRYALDHITPLEDALRDKLSVGLIVQDNPYGQRINQHAEGILRTQGNVTAEKLTLSDDVLAEETALRKSVKAMTQWFSPSSEGAERPPRFDIVIIAGDISFGLRIAPVLSWYDLDPSKVKYLGTSQWMAASILQEPSLEGGWFASQPVAASDDFQLLWTATNQGYPSKYAMMSFDAVALISTIDSDQGAGFDGILSNGSGFNGFSGAFKLTPDGGNMRQLEIRQIKPGGFDVIVPASTSF